MVSAQRLTLCRLEELDLLAGLLLECGDGLLDRRVLLGIDSLVPPNDEVSAPEAQLFCAFCPQRRPATDVMGGEKGLGTCSPKRGTNLLRCGLGG